MSLVYDLEGLASTIIAVVDLAVEIDCIKWTAEMQSIFIATELFVFLRS
jgi:hypothetical protein